MTLDLQESIVTARPQFPPSLDAGQSPEALQLPSWAETHREKLADGEVVTVRLGHSTDACELLRLASSGKPHRLPEARSIPPGGSTVAGPDPGAIFVVTVTVEGSEDLIAYGDYRPEGATSFAEGEVFVRDDWKGLGIEALLERRLADLAKVRGRRFRPA